MAKTTYEILLQLSGDKVVANKLNNTEKQVIDLEKKSGVLKDVLAGLSQGAGIAAFTSIQNVVASSLQAVGGAIVGAVQKYGELDLALTNFSAKSGLARDSLGELQKQTFDLAKITAQTPVGIAQTATALLTLGASAEQVSTSLRSVTLLADSLGEDPVLTGKVLQTGINIFGRFGQTSDTLADKISKLINTTAAGSSSGVAEFLQLFQTAGSAAAALGGNFDELSAAFATLRDNGADASVAATGLKIAYLSLANPIGKGAKAIKQIGLEAFDANGNFIGLEETLRQFNDATNDLTVKERVSLATRIFGREGAPSILALLNDLNQENSRFAATLGTVGNAAGDVEKQIEILNQAVARQFEIFTGSLETIQTQFGQALAPLLNEILLLFNELAGSAIDADLFSGLAEAIKFLASGIRFLRENKEALTQAVRVLTTAFLALKAVQLTTAIAALSQQTIAFTNIVAGSAGVTTKLGTALGFLGAKAGITSAGLATAGTAAGGLLATLAPLALAVGALGVVLENINIINFSTQLQDLKNLDIELQPLLDSAFQSAFKTKAIQEELNASLKNGTEVTQEQIKAAQDRIAQNNAEITALKEKLKAIKAVTIAEQFSNDNDDAARQAQENQIAQIEQAIKSLEGQNTALDSSVKAVNEKAEADAIAAVEAEELAGSYKEVSKAVNEQIEALKEAQGISDLRTSIQLDTGAINQDQALNQVLDARLNFNNEVVRLNQELLQNEEITAEERVKVENKITNALLDSERARIEQKQKLRELDKKSLEADQNLEIKAIELKVAQSILTETEGEKQILDTKKKFGQERIAQIQSELKEVGNNTQKRKELELEIREIQTSIGKEINAFNKKLEEERLKQIEERKKKEQEADQDKLDRIKALADVEINQVQRDLNRGLIEKEQAENQIAKITEDRINKELALLDTRISREKAGSTERIKLEQEYSALVVSLSEQQKKAKEELLNRQLQAIEKQKQAEIELANAQSQANQLRSQALSGQASFLSGVSQSLGQINSLLEDENISARTRVQLTRVANSALRELQATGLAIGSQGTLAERIQQTQLNIQLEQVRIKNEQLALEAQDIQLKSRVKQLQEEQLILQEQARIASGSLSDSELRAAQQNIAFAQQRLSLAKQEEQIALNINRNQQRAGNLESSLLRAQGAQGSNTTSNVTSRGNNSGIPQVQIPNLEQLLEAQKTDLKTVSDASTRNVEATNETNNSLRGVGQTIQQGNDNSFKNFEGLARSLDSGFGSVVSTLNSQTNELIGIRQIISTQLPSINNNLINLPNRIASLIPPPQTFRPS